MHTRKALLGSAVKISDIFGWQAAGYARIRHPSLQGALQIPFH